MDDIIGQELPDTYFDRANETREAFITRMEAAGYRIVTPKSNELLVFEAKYKEHESRSGYPRRHVIVMLPFDVDPVRELRLRRGDVHPTLFVEAPAGTEGKNIIEDFDPIL